MIKINAVLRVAFMCAAQHSTYPKTHFLLCHFLLLFCFLKQIKWLEFTSQIFYSFNRHGVGMSFFNRYSASIDLSSVFRNNSHLQFLTNVLL